MEEIAFIAGEELIKDSLVYKKADGKLYMSRCKKCEEPIKYCRCSVEE